MCLRRRRTYAAWKLHALLALPRTVSGRIVVVVLLLWYFLVVVVVLVHVCVCVSVRACVTHCVFVYVGCVKHTVCVRFCDIIRKEISNTLPKARTPYDRPGTLL
jgi:hypothetical protein